MFGTLSYQVVSLIMNGRNYSSQAPECQCLSWARVFLGASKECIGVISHGPIPEGELTVFLLHNAPLSQHGFLCPEILPSGLGRDRIMMEISWSERSEARCVLLGCGSVSLLPEVKWLRATAKKKLIRYPACSFAVLTLSLRHFFPAHSTPFHSCAAKGRSVPPVAWANTPGSPAVIAQSLWGKHISSGLHHSLAEVRWKPRFKK